MKLSKIVVSMFCFISLFFMVNVVEVQASSYKPYDDASYELTYKEGEDGGIMITGYSGTAEGKLVIPDEIDGVKVTSIRSAAFLRCSGLTGDLIIPESVTSIGGSAFNGCSELSGVLMIPESVNSIGPYAFANCPNMIPYIYITEKTEYIAETAFNSMGRQDIVIYAPLDSYAEEFARSYAYNFKEWNGEDVNPVMIENISLNKNSWVLKTGESYTLTAQLTPSDIYYSQVKWSSSDESVATVTENGNVETLSEGVATITATTMDGSELSASCIITVKKKFTYKPYADANYELTFEIGEDDCITISKCPDYASGALVIPGDIYGVNVTAIKNNAFYFCNQLTGDLIIPDGVTTIGHKAFMYCYGLDGRLVIPESVMSIEDSAFESCYSLTGELVIPNGIKTIESGVFCGCLDLTGELVIPEGVIKIGENAFAGCKGFTGNVIIPKSVTEIGAKAFYGCISMSRHIYITENTIDIKGDAFVLTVAGGLPDTPEKHQDMTIHAPKGSYAEEFAKANYYCYLEWNSEDTGAFESTANPQDGKGILIYENGELVYLSYGVINTSKTGLVKYVDDVWLYVREGKVDRNTNGFVEQEGELFFISLGELQRTANGLIGYNNEWYFVSLGQVQKQHTGLALYDGEWFYINEGRLDTQMAGYVEYDGSLFYVGAGRIITEANGLAQDPITHFWYYLSAGQVQTQYTGLAYYDGQWFYVVNGVLDLDFTGEVMYDGSLFQVQNGMLVG